MIHGGFWKQLYGAEYGAPLAVDLAARGWTAVNVEYRRVGVGADGRAGEGGHPETFDDIATAIDLLRDIDVDLSKVIALGHSAGGHLAAWAAARHRFERWAGGVRLSGVVAQAGVLDLAAAYDEGLGGGAVERFAGPPRLAYDLIDPARHQPLDVPVRCVHPRDDEDVPLRYSEEYVARASSGATLTVVEGDHYAVIDPESAAWRVVVGELEAIAPRR